MRDRKISCAEWKGGSDMSDKQERIVIIATHAEESPDKATIPFVMGSTALAMDVDVSIILQVTGVYLALKGYADHVHAAGFPPLLELQETFFEAGGKLLVCSPCMQARKTSLRIWSLKLRSSPEPHWSQRSSQQRMW
jgi:predicted peroxiredoxin